MSLRIAINAWFADQPTTGSGQYLTHLLAEYKARREGHQFLLCLPAGSGARDGAGTPFEWRVLRTPYDGLNRHLSKVWFEQISFPVVCRRWAADVIHVPYWASPLFPPAPTVVTVHDLIPLLLPAYGGGVVGRLYTRLVALSARRAARVLTDSQASRQDIVRYLKLDPGRVQTVYLAAHDRYQPLSDPQELTRVGHKYDLSPRYLLYLGGFDVRKNVINILRAWARLAHSSTSPPSEARLVVAGQLPSQDSTFAPDPRRAARELGVAEQVQFTGWVDEEDKPALYSGAVAFLFPSHYEGFGLPPLEAMSCGTPAIVSGRGSLPEVVGEAGLCVDPDDVDALAWAVRQILEDAALRERLSQAALTQAASFCWGRTAQETLAAYLAAAR